MQRVPQKFLEQRVALSLFGYLILGFISAGLALHLVSLRDPDRLVPVSVADIFGAIPLALLLYLLGSVLVLRFPIQQAFGWYSCFFIVRILSALFLSTIVQFDDELAFHYAGLEQVYGWVSFKAGRAYYHLVNTLYSVFGPNILLPKMVNVYIGSLLPLFAYDIGYWLFGERKAAWRAFLFTGLLPPFVVFSAVNLKEISTGYLLVLLVWILLNPRREGFWKVVGVGITVWILYWLRGAPLAMVGILGVMIYYIFSLQPRFSKIIKVATVLVPVALFVVPPLLNSIQSQIWSRTKQEEYFIQRFAESEATVTRFLNVENPFSLKNIAILGLRGLFSPTPLRFMLDYGIGTLIEALNMLVWYALFPLAVISLLVYRRKVGVIVCGIIMLAVFAIATMGIMVGSDPYRHRMMAMGFVAILGSGGLKKNVLYRYRWVVSLWILGAIGFTGLWFILRIEG